MWLHKGQKFYKETWKKGLYIEYVPSKGAYRYFMGDGQCAGKPSAEMLKTNDFEIYKENKMTIDKNYTGKYTKVAVCTRMRDGKRFSCKIGPELDIEGGDLVVIDTNQGLTLAKAGDVYNTCNLDYMQKMPTTPNVWVVDKIDLSAQEARKLNTEKREMIIKRLEEKKDKMEAIELYSFLGKVDPEAKELLKELKKL